MIDYYIFGFGCIVTVVVGSGLSAMIIAHNRAADARAKTEQSPRPELVRVPQRRQ